MAGDPSLGMDDVRLAKFLAAILHEILRHRVSVDVAFKRVCGGRCASSLEEREALYETTRRFIADYVKLRCAGVRRPRDMARLWLSGFTEPVEPYCRLSIPEWLYSRIEGLLGGEALDLFKAMERRVWWLRVNTLKTSIESATRALEAEGVEFEVSKHYPYMLKILKSPKPVRLLRVVREFKVIPQDVASVAVVEALRPEPGDRILDACAAPGMKTSLIVMLAEGRVKVKAVDISGRRMMLMKSLMKKLGVPEGVVDYVIADSRYIRLEEFYDKALVDAPCSNSGAIAKDPSLRITLTPGKVEYYSGLQRSILANILRYASKVTYATCSILPEEGEEVVEAFTDKARIEKPSIPTCREGYSAYRSSSSVCRLYPHIHESEGFFIANLTPT